MSGRGFALLLLGLLAIPLPLLAQRPGFVALLPALDAAWTARGHLFLLSGERLDALRTVGERLVLAPEVPRPARSLLRDAAFVDADGSAWAVLGSGRAILWQGGRARELAWRSPAPVGARGARRLPLRWGADWCLPDRDGVRLLSAGQDERLLAWPRTVTIRPGYGFGYDLRVRWGSPSFRELADPEGRSSLLVMDARRCVRTTGDDEVEVPLSRDGEDGVLGIPWPLPAAVAALDFGGPAAALLADPSQGTISLLEPGQAAPTVRVLGGQVLRTALLPPLGDGDPALICAVLMPKMNPLARLAALQGGRIPARLVVLPWTRDAGLSRSASWQRRLTLSIDVSVVNGERRGRLSSIVVPLGAESAVVLQPDGGVEWHHGEKTESLPPLPEGAPHPSGGLLPFSGGREWIVVRTEAAGTRVLRLRR